MLNLGRDTNGNKTLKYRTGTSQKGFSVQTLGNLPFTHKLTKDELSENENFVYNELICFVKLHGTDRQKKLLNIHYDLNI